jgi:3-hydroxybutyryl-CoA dehydrogenase
MLTFEEITRMTMVGAGTMGAGMGLCFAQAGYQVTIYSRSQAGLDRALSRVDKIQALFVEEGLIDEQQAQAARQRISTTTSLEEALDGTQYVLESVPENLALKQEMFRQMDGLCSAEAVLTTNTSGLSITAIASVCRHPDRVGGMHWANPPELVPLVEVVRGEQTTDNTVDVIYRMIETMGKVPVKVQKEIPGFASNRLQYALLREALYLVEQGVVSIEDVDRTLKCGIGFRYPWLGQLETVDLGGAEIFHTISQYLWPTLSTAQSTPAFFDDLIRAGKTGIKAGAGFYEYQPGAREEILRQRDVYFIRQLKLLNAMRGKGQA